MTNTRLTDPEIFERRYPVRLSEFSIRRGSGGAGPAPRRRRRRPADRISAAAEVSLLTQRRGPSPPYGLGRRPAGALGRNTLLHADGRVEDLGAGPSSRPRGRRADDRNA